MMSGGDIPEPFALGVIGDSNANGASNVITQCALRTLYNFNGTSYDEITTQSVSNSFPLLGSIWQPFATAYKTAFAAPVYLMNAAKGGTYYCPSGTSGSPNAAAANSWGSNGDLRALFQTKVTNGLAALGKASLDLIVVNLGVNDVRNAYASGTILTAMDNFAAWLTVTYPGVPVLFIQVGRSETTVSSTTFYQVREHTADLAQSNTNMHMCCTALPFAFISGGYEADLLHYTAATQITMAGQLVEWLKNSTYSKWGRSVISSLFDIPSSARKTLINNFISSQVTSGNYFLLEGFFNLKTSTANNMLLDWTFIGFGAPNSGTFLSDDCLQLDGVDDYFATGIDPNIYIGSGAGQNNVLVGCHVKANSSAGTVALFGAGNAAQSLSLVQNTVRYRVNDLTLSAGTDTVFQANTLYSIRRNGTTKSLVKNKTQNASVVQASTGLVNGVTMVYGATQVSPSTISSWIQADIQMCYYANFTGFDIDNFYDNWNTLLTNW